MNPLRQLALGGIVMAFALGGTAWGQDTAGSADEESPISASSGPAPSTAEGVDVSPFVYLRHSGYFRFRADAFGRTHIHDGAAASDLVSGQLPPLSGNQANNGPNGQVDSADRKRDYLASANIRFRWEPTLVVDDEFFIHAQLDILDNVVLGSTPNFGVNDPLNPLSFFADSNRSPSPGVNSLDQAIRVKRLFGRWELIHFIAIEFGRMPYHWGAGIVNNDGNCLDCDRGNTVDRLGFTAGPLDLGVDGARDLYISFGWDFPGEGAIFSTPWRELDADGDPVTRGAPASFFGQPYDLTDVDDVEQYVVSIENVARSLAGKARFDKAMNEERRPFLQWGWYNQFRTQDYSLDGDADDFALQACEPAPTSIEGFTDPRLETQYDCYALVAREAFSWTTDFWVRLDWEPKLGHRFRFEVELAGLLLGELGQTGDDDGDDTSKEFWGGAGMLRTSYAWPNVELGIELGVASGDPDSPYAGVEDGSNVIVDENSTAAADRLVFNDDVYTQFRFNRDYIIDLLLFREVIGAVTNAIYVRPHVKWDFLEVGDFRIGTQWNLLYAAAMFPDGTPGGGQHWGFETDGQFYVEVEPFFKGVLEGGFLVPLDALDVPGLPDPEMSWTMQARMMLTF